MIFLKKFITGIVIGVTNMLLGAGGGMITVPFYLKNGMNQKEAQINAIATILPITIISAIIYLLNNNVNFKDAFPFLIPGLIGGILGTFLIKKIKNQYLSIAFAIFMIWSGVRLLIK